MDFAGATKRFEGFAPRASWDYKQNTNGYGTRALFAGEQIDRAEAERRFADEYAKARSHVDSFAPQAPDGVKAALTDLTFNAGPGWSNSGLGQAVKHGDWSAAKERFLQYNKAGGQTNPGLVSRRNEGATWFDGAPTTAPAGAPALDSAMNANASAGSQMPPQPTQVFAPALSPNSMMGPGALGGEDNSAQVIGNGMERAAAWLGSISDPKALGALAALKPDHDQYTVIQGQDGKLYRYSKKTGAVQAVDRGTGDTINPMTPGQKKVDEDYAKDFNEFKANGGYATAARNIDELGGVIHALKTEKGLTGGMVNYGPDGLTAILEPRALEMKQKAHGILQQQMRAIYGPQFTQTEGEGFLARTYDPRLSQDANAAKLESVQTQMKRSAAAKQSAADYFEKHGSLTGWQGKLPSFKEDLNGDGVPDAAQTTAPATTAAPGFKVLKVH